MPVLPDEFARPEDRLADGRLVHDKFHDPAGLTTIGFGVDSIGALGLENGLEKQLAFSRALRAPSCIHVNETGTISRLHASGLLGPDLLVVRDKLIRHGAREVV